MQYIPLREEHLNDIEKWMWCISYEKDCEHCPHYSPEDEVCNFDK
jgi:hypothetical protein